jgi:hypothetical protein
VRPLHGERAENTGQAQQRVTPADAAGLMCAIADKFAVGTEHGISQADRINIEFFIRVHDIASVVDHFTFRRGETARVQP